MLKIIMSSFKTDSMSKTKCYFFLLLIIGFVACKNESKPTENNANVSANTPAILPTIADIEHIETTRRQIDANNNGMVAAGYIVNYPSVKKGSPALTESVKKWAHTFICGQVGFPVIIDPAKGFEPYVLMFRQAVESNKSIKSWEVNISDNIIYNTMKISSLRIDAKTNFGSSRDNKVAAVNSFDPQTGEILSLEKLVTNQSEMLVLCEKNLRSAKTNIFKNGFKFTKDSPFRLPKNFAITPQGMLFHYNPQEIAPSILDDVEFTIPFEQLEKIMDLKKFI
jgi:Protein of unknown function (DUF3298)